MPEISLVELFVYGLFAYSGMIVLIISVIKEVPNTKSLSIVRAIYLIPSIIAAGVLTQIGPSISTTSVQNTITALNTSEVFQEVITTEITIQNDIWALFHLMLFLVMMIYVISNILLLATRRE